MLAENVVHQNAVGDVALDELVARMVAHLFEILQVPGIGELVEYDHSEIAVLAEYVLDEIAPYETRPTGHKQSFGHA